MTVANREAFQAAVSTDSVTKYLTLAERGNELKTVSDATNIGINTLQGMKSGAITPSKNQRRKIFGTLEHIAV